MKEIVISILILLGSFFMLVAATGLLRFPDTLSRLHATTKAPSFGMLLLVIAVCLYFASIVVILKAVLLILFIYLTAPLAAHSISKSKPKD
ncbi:MAG: monovalent cation/H(+) antiporter subunit G [Bacteroidales bacterium]